MKDYFSELSAKLQGLLQAGEEFSCTYQGEQSDFCRFNKSKIRQAGQVSQHYLKLRLVKGQRHAAAKITLQQNLATDLEQIKGKLTKLRELIPRLPEDPYLLLKDQVESSDAVAANELPPKEQMIDCILGEAEGVDLVGILATGGIFRGFANSAGQLNYYETWSFNFDFCLYLHTDKAVKSGYAGFRFDPVEFKHKFLEARQQLKVLENPQKTLNPGQYDVFLTPAALGEILDVVAWGGFGLKSIKTKNSPLNHLFEGKRSLSPKVTIRELGQGVPAQNFDADGFLKPVEQYLIKEGQAGDPLANPRSAKEYGVSPTGSADESPKASRMNGGSLAEGERLRTLGTGLWISNLWYLNFSDRGAGQITGMTRFATFWVENGEIVAPASVMRFDDNLFDVLGNGLEDLTKDRQILLSPGSYYERSTDSQELPGAIVRGFHLTL